MNYKAVYSLFDGDLLPRGDRRSEEHAPIGAIAQLSVHLIAIHDCTKFVISQITKMALFDTICEILRLPIALFLSRVKVNVSSSDNPPPSLD